MRHEPDRWDVWGHDTWPPSLGEELHWRDMTPGADDRPSPREKWAAIEAEQRLLAGVERAAGGDKRAGQPPSEHREAA